MLSAINKADKGETRELGQSLSQSSMETDAAPQHCRGSAQRTPPQDHTVQLPDVPYDEVSLTERLAGTA